MDSILLIISNGNLRQLYHELLFSPNVEIVPSSDISHALLSISLQEFAGIVVYVEDENEMEVAAFLRLRKKHRSLLDTKVILLSSQNALFADLLTKIDRVVDIDKVSPGKIAAVIFSCLRN